MGSRTARTVILVGNKDGGKECRSVESYRCEQCGLLRSFASEEVEPPSMWGT